MTEKALKPIKPFLNYEEQIKNLVERKGMVITDRKFAASKLENISYYALIDGYKNLFYNPMTRKYREGTTFEDIVALYEFDEKLRALIFQYLCHFEQKMSSLISYHFCDTYSERQRFYDTEVIAFATPVYYYEMARQMKTLLDQANFSKLLLLKERAG